jgi:hypothetical protein
LGCGSWSWVGLGWALGAGFWVGFGGWVLVVFWVVLGFSFPALFWCSFSGRVGRWFLGSVWASCAAPCWARFRPARLAVWGFPLAFYGPNRCLFFGALRLLRRFLGVSKRLPVWAVGGSCGSPRGSLFLAAGCAAAGGWGRAGFGAAGRRRGGARFLACCGARPGGAFSVLPGACRAGAPWLPRCAAGAGCVAAGAARARGVFVFLFLFSVCVPGACPSGCVPSFRIRF